MSMHKTAVLLSVVALLTIAADTLVAVPNAPTALAAAISGNTVTLTWNGPGGVVSAYLLEAGSAPGLSDVASGQMGRLAVVCSHGCADGRVFRSCARNQCRGSRAGIQ